MAVHAGTAGEDAAGLATVLGLPPLPPAQGASAVAERALFFFGPSAAVSLEPFTVEGRAAVVARHGSQVLAVVRLDQRRGRIFHLHATARRSVPRPAERPVSLFPRLLRRCMA